MYDRLTENENVSIEIGMNWNILKYHERRKHKQIKEDEKIVFYFS